MSLYIEQNGMGGGIATALHCFLLTDDAPMSPFNSGESEDVMKKKVYKETDYSKKLRDPRWQKMRLQILERDEFTCTSCYNSEDTLHVHHRYYEAGKDPWEYPAEALVTLCENCHEVETDDLAKAKQRLIKALSHWGFLAEQFNRVAAAIETSEPYSGHEPCADILAFAITDEDSREFITTKFWADLRVAAEAMRKDRESQK